MEFVFVLALVALVAFFHAAVWSGILVAIAYLSLGWVWVVLHPLQIVGYGAGYLLIGAIWSVLKWWFSETNAVREAKEKYYLYKIGAESLETYLKRRKTEVKSHKEAIIFWISFWPLNATYTLLNDPIRRAARRIWLELQGVYERITDHVWKG